MVFNSSDTKRRTQSPSLDRQFCGVTTRDFIDCNLRWLPCLLAVMPVNSWESLLRRISLFAACLTLFACATAPMTDPGGVPYPPSSLRPDWSTQNATSLLQCQSRPKYPAEARVSNQQGTVTIRFRVDGDGKVIESTVVETSGFPLLDESARQFVLTCLVSKDAVKNSLDSEEAQVTLTFKLGQ